MTDITTTDLELTPTTSTQEEATETTNRYLINGVIFDPMPEGVDPDQWDPDV